MIEKDNFLSFLLSVRWWGCYISMFLLFGSKYPCYNNEHLWPNPIKLTIYFLHFCNDKPVHLKRICRYFSYEKTFKLRQKLLFCNVTVLRVSCQKWKRGIFLVFKYIGQSWIIILQKKSINYCYSVQHYFRQCEESYYWILLSICCF